MTKCGYCLCIDTVHEACVPRDTGVSRESLVERRNRQCRVGVRGWLLLNELNNTLGYEGISQTLGVGLPVGISMYHDKAAIDLYFEFAPVLKILPSSEFGMQAGIGLRMYPTLPFLKAKPKK